MHIYIYNIGEIRPFDDKKIPVGEDLEDICGGYTNLVDYVNPVFDKKRKDAIENLAKKDLKGMFKVENENELVYIGGFERCRKKVWEKLKEDFDKLNEENFTLRMELLKPKWENPLNTPNLFYLSSFTYYLSRSCDLMRWLNALHYNDTLKEGFRLKVYDVLDAHV